MTITHADPDHLTGQDTGTQPAHGREVGHGVREGRAEEAVVRDDLRRLGFLATLEARTWAARSRAAGVLADPAAVSSRAAYAAWLRRVRAAWALVPLPGPPDPGRWPFGSVDPGCLDVLGALEADLREVTMAAGGSSFGSPSAPARRGGWDGPDAAGETATLAGAVYAAVVLGSDAAVLVPAALALATEPRAPIELRFLRRCTAAATARTPLRRDLARWAEGLPQPDGRDAAERAVRTACSVMHGVAEALHARRPGW